MICHVHVKPNAKVDSISIKENNELEIRIRAIPVEGKANKYLVEYLSTIFKLSKSSIVILKGLNSPHKIIEVIANDKYIKKVLARLTDK